MSARFAIARPLESLLHGASDRADALFDQRRRLADISHGLTAIVENAQVPLKAVLAVDGGRRLAVVVLVRRSLNCLVLRADTSGQGVLLVAGTFEAADDLGALLRQILEGRGESAE